MELTIGRFAVREVAAFDDLETVLQAASGVVEASDPLDANDISGSN